MARHCFPVLFLSWAAGVTFVQAADGTPALAEWDGRRIAELARQLKDDAYACREGANRELAKAPVTVMPVLEQLAENAEDPESRYRLHLAARALFLKWIAPRLPEWSKGRGFLGIGWEVHPEEAGVLVTTVFPNSAADRAGLKVDDVILSVDGRPFEKGVTMEDVKPVWRNMFPDDRLNLTVKREGQAEPLKIVAVVGQPPEGQSSFDSGAPSESEKEENLWMRYRRGRLQLPQLPRLFDAAKFHERQSWPAVLERK